MTDDIGEYRWQQRIEAQETREEQLERDLEQARAEGEALVDALRDCERLAAIENNSPRVRCGAYMDIELVARAALEQYDAAKGGVPRSSDSLSLGGKS